MINESETSPVPDLMIVDTATELTRVIIEITHTQGVNKDLKKLKNLMNDYDVPEGFVYDYKLNQWTRYGLGAESEEKNMAFCHQLGFDLDSLV